MKCKFNSSVKNNSRWHKESGAGFTIIELLVVVAIVAILVSIVLFNVIDWINQGKDSAIRANLSTIATNGSIYFENNASYTDFCTSSSVSVPEAAITGAGGNPYHICTDTSWCACSILKVSSGRVFCVDNAGQKKESASDCTTACSALGSCI